MSEQLLAAQEILKVLEEAGYEAYMVGGCVRDSLLGKIPADYDVTTNAHPKEVIKIFPRTIPTGLQHGTVSVLHRDIVTEVTTYRVEGMYEDHRRPKNVTFVPHVKDDLLRRDFTINAMAMDRDGKVMDYLNGQEDLKAGVIRAVGDAEERFKEDALRMLRACRFAAQLSFEIDEDTLQAMRINRSLASYLAVERVVAEFEKIWKTRQPSQGLKPLIQTGLLSKLNPFHFISITTEVQKKEWKILDKLHTPLEKWVYFLYLVFSQTEQCKQVCKTNILDILPKFKFSNSVKRAISSFIQLITSWDTQITMEQGKLLLLQYDHDSMLQAQRLWQLISKKSTDLPFTIWWEQMPIHQFSELAINGEALMQVTGKTAGPWLKETLLYLYHQVAFGYIQNEKVVLEKEGGKYGTSLT